ncbi:50S ribosomal protein L21 [bacterium]|nr:50S ribosomal protein L21 [bacterium]
MLAVIETGSKQYLVEPGQTIRTELVSGEKEIVFEPLMVIDGDDVKIGTPKVAGAKVVAIIEAADEKADKVRVLKFKAKKREKTLRGHRQHYSLLKIAAITA